MACGKLAADGRSRYEAAARTLKLPNYFFFLGFLTSFLGPLSFAIGESSLIADYTRLTRASSEASRIPPKVSAGSPCAWRNFDERGRFARLMRTAYGWR